MAKRKRYDLHQPIMDYAESRGFEFKQFSEVHWRITDPGFTSVDLWPTTGRYYVRETNYVLQTKRAIVERGGEGGILYTSDGVEEFLDRLFYAADMVEL